MFWVVWKAAVVNNQPTFSPKLWFFINKKVMEKSPDEKHGILSNVLEIIDLLI